MPSLASEVEEYRGVVQTLESGMAREAPPAGLFDVVLSRIEAERSAEALPAATPAETLTGPTVATAPEHVPPGGGDGSSSRSQQASRWLSRSSRSPSPCRRAPDLGSSGRARGRARNAGVRGRSR